MYGSACGSRERNRNYTQNTKDSRHSKENKDSWNSENRNAKENKDSRDTKNKDSRNTEEDKNSRNSKNPSSYHNSHIHPERLLSWRAESGYPHMPLLLNYSTILDFSSYLTLKYSCHNVQYPNVHW